MPKQKLLEFEFYYCGLLNYFLLNLAKLLNYADNVCNSYSKFLLLLQQIDETIYNASFNGL